GYAPHSLVARLFYGSCRRYHYSEVGIQLEKTSWICYFAAQMQDQSLLVLHEEVQLSIARPDTVILDVRTIQEYQGEHFLMKPPEVSERAGHIPSSIHIEHILTVNEDGTFKSFDELQMLYSSHGITSDREVFPYCAVGGRSGYIWFVLKYLLGYPKVRNYDGSWNEWSRLSNVPIEK
ncbi:MAG: hypothetical protein F6K24_08115, partial [Okeania sp. SIO2D1]|nr:hypothetical protein [Okeania sp. SIO2D1]